MREEIREGIGKSTAAQQRGAGLRAARSGLGAGASPELLETQGEIGREGLRAAGQADAGAVLGSMSLGGQMAGAGIGGLNTIRGQDLSTWLGSEQLALTQWLQDQSLQHGSDMDERRLQQEADLQQQALDWEAWWRELSMMGAY